MNMAKDLHGALEDVLAYNKGKLTLKNYKVLEPPKNISASKIKKIREKFNYSQAVFALLVGVSVTTVQSWEQGLRSPLGSSLRMLEIINSGYPQLE